MKKNAGVQKAHRMQKEMLLKYNRAIANDVVRQKERLTDKTQPNVLFAA